MFFKKKTCDHCNALYDPLADSCPQCGTTNLDNIDFKKKTKICWIPLYYQILVFIIGFVIFQVVSYLFSIIFKNIGATDQVQALMLVNLCSYLLCFAGVSLALFNYVKSIIKGYNKLATYLIGIGGGIAVIAISYLLTYLASLVRPGSGGNQSAAILIIKTYPAVGIIILGIIGPILEEITYRLGLFSFTARINRAAAYVICGVIFGLIHFDFRSTDLILELLLLPNYICAGLLFSHIYERGGLISSIVAHIVNNLFAVIQVLILVK